ncbi:MAG TPA: class I SAM-dependent methyltransferase [Bacteroidales bacterium]|nr:class I SAM-dependent methyltransferase [Bacteroidales bacterium]
MNKLINGLILFVMMTILLCCSRDNAYTQGPDDLDKRVNDFLNSHVSGWHDMNVPASDGKLLYDIILKNNYKNALEIGTSTGHSGIWMAWALSKTGGKLTTIEINERRYNEALENFKKAGLIDYIDARLADAHELVKTLPGPFDFVFSDADKDWYVNYFRAIDPKLSVGGCFTSHNIGMYGARDFYEFIKSLPYYTTSVDYNGAGMSISYKTDNP